MKTLLIFLFISVTVNAQSVFGKWKTFNSDGEFRSIVEVFEKDGYVNGRIVRIAVESKRNNLCTECKGKDKNQKIEGLVLMKKFVWDEDAYVNGTITNPDDGKVYRAKFWLDEENPNILRVRGYIGFFYKTMEWRRIPQS
ncbi:MAG: DUF2147 domain-containing protein [Gelidibacter sp.]